VLTDIRSDGVGRNCNFFAESATDGYAEDQKPLTLALSRRERGLTAVDVRDPPT